MVIFGISIIVRMYRDPSPLHPPWSSETNFFFSFFVLFQMKHVAVVENWTWRPKNSKRPLSKTLFLMKSYIFWSNYATKVSDTSIPMFSGMLNAMDYSKNDYREYIKNKIQDGCQNKFFCNFRDLISLNYQWVPQYVTHWSFSSHWLLFNTRGLCCLLRHHMPTSSQLFINRSSVR